MVWDRMGMELPKRYSNGSRIQGIFEETKEKFYRIMNTCYEHEIHAWYVAILPDIRGNVGTSFSQIITSLLELFGCTSWIQKVHSSFFLKFSYKNPMKRLFLNISTTGCVVLFTMGALSMIESENYLMMGVFFFFAFYIPLQEELNSLFMRKFRIDAHKEKLPKTCKSVDLEEESR